MRDILQGKKIKKEKKKKFDERIANMQRIDNSDDDSDDSGDDAGKELRRFMRASREAYAFEQGRMDETQGGAGASRAPPYTNEDTAREGPRIHSYIGPKV